MCNYLNLMCLGYFSLKILVMIHTKPQNVDEYIAGFDGEVREILETVRATIKKAAPKAEEIIAYRMPAYRMNTVLVYFAANKNHLGFYPTGKGIEAFKEDLEAYKWSRGTIQFPYSKKIPLGLISKIVKYRVQQDIASAGSSKKLASKT
jgi:uncharacterized protein YdhG (YjbR/CyaY superfamily)